MEHLGPHIEARNLPATTSVHEDSCDLKHGLAVLANRCFRSGFEPSTATDHSSAASPEPGVLGFGLLQNRDVGIGVLPQLEEVLERLSGFRRLACERGAACQPEIRQ